MCVAAEHLDRLKSTVLAGLEHITGSKTEAQVAYLQQQVTAAESTISVAIENIQCCLSDIVASAEES
jgi:hypothetical protein